MLGGYTWSADVDESSKTIHLDVYLLIAASRVIEIPGGQAKVTMQSSLPSRGEVSFEFEAPKGWKWAVRLPQPEYAENIKVSPVISGVKAIADDQGLGTHSTRLGLPFTRATRILFCQNDLFTPCPPLGFPPCHTPRHAHHSTWTNSVCRRIDR
jgi:hypothetical protein